ncbi:MAG: DUF5606 domain-containing protein [Bacteroidales bacterium]
MTTIKVKDLMSISGKGGLFRFLAQARNGVVVETLTDKKRSVVPPTARVSALDDISIFGVDEDVPLADVLMMIHEKENGGASIDPKSGNEALKAYFTEVLPDYDPDKVYVSDIKKVITWYNILHELDLLELVDKEEESEEGQEGHEESNDEDKEEKSDKNEPRGRL